MAKSSSASSKTPVAPPHPRSTASRSGANGASSRRSSLTGATTAPHIPYAPDDAIARPSALALLALVLAALVCFAAPLTLSGFAPATYDYAPQALWLALLSGLAVVLVGVAVVQRTAGTQRQPRSLIGILLLVFLAWCCASVVRAVYLHDALLEAARLLGVVAWFFLARGVLRRVPSAGIVLIAASIGGGVWIAGSALFNFYVTSYPRQSGGFLNPNLFASWGAMLVPLALALTLQLSLLTRRHFDDETAYSGLWKWGALFSGLATFLIAGGLAVTSSKGGFLALLVGLIVFVIAVMRARGKQVGRALRTYARIVVPLALVVLVLGSFVAAKTVLPRLQQARGTDDNSTMFRLYTWRGTWAMTRARPVLGWGAGSFPSAYPQFAITGDTRSAHESWLQLASECGVLAPLLLLAAGGAAFARGWRGLKTRTDWPLVAGGFGAATALLVHGFTDDPWKIIATAALGLFALALLDSDSTPVDSARQKEKVKTQTLTTSPFAFLPFAFCLALAAWWTSRSATAVSLWKEASAQLSATNGSFALPAADNAVAVMPLSSRAQVIRAWCLQATGDTKGAQTALERAALLQPTSALPPSEVATLLANSAPQEIATIARSFDRAVSLAPNNVDVLLKRGAWRLAHKYATGWNDYRKVVALADAPYGRYPALGQDVNLDFDRARLKIASRARNVERARLLKRVFADVDRAKGNDAMLFYTAEEAIGVAGAVQRRAEEIAEVEQQANQLNRG